MNPTITIGRIAGVKIGLNWSWAIVLALIVWSLAAAVFPDQNPGLSHASYALMAIAAALLFFSSIVLHELGHALQARREGVEMDGITLWLFGGVARFKGDLPSAGAELRIAIAGPAVTAAIASICALAGGITQLPTEVDGVVVWLGYINLILLVFNLLPAFPLDGGRVLRAALWSRGGHFDRATRSAANVSRVFAFILILLGLALFVGNGVFSGAWLAFIGWFLLQAAASEARYPLIREALSGLTVRNLMVPDPLVAEGRQTLSEFVAEEGGVARYTSVPVLDGARVIGLLPFKRVLETPRGQWDTRRVAEAMIPLEDVVLLGLDEPAIDALADLSQGDLHRALVLDGTGRLAGLVSISDFSRVLALPHGRG